MIILNATRTVKTIMTDNNKLITIQPGEVSQMMIASRNLIVTAINLGSPSEIGIIISGSYEMDVTKSITGSIPYLYTDIDEAKSKLLDSSIDYKQNLNQKKDNIVHEAEMKEKDDKIKTLKGNIESLNAELDSIKNSDRMTEISNENKSLELKIKELISDKTRLTSQVQDMTEQLDSVTKNLNSVRSQLGSKVQDYASQSSLIDKLSGQLKDSESKVTALNTKYKDYDDIHTALKQATDQIDKMKSEFNEACNKFGITKDESGNWVQVEN